MLNNEEFLAYVGSLKLPMAGIEYLERIRETGSSRRVQSGGMNMTARFPSKKMGRVLQAESRTLELPTAIALEHDNDVLEFYDQPAAIKLLYSSANGKQVGVLHTPDYLKLARSGPGFIECKPEEVLLELAVSMPNRYQKNAEGKWICPPGEVAAGLLGLTYEVISSVSVSAVKTRNLLFLNDFLDPVAQPPDEAVSTRVRNFLRSRPGPSLKDLLAAMPDLTVDNAYGLLATGLVYCDLEAAPVSDPARVLLFETDVAAKAYNVLRDANTKAGNVSDSLRTAQLEAFNKASDADWEVALDRLKSLQAEPEKLSCSERTRLRLQEKFNKAEQVLGCGLYGLLPKTNNRGNRQVKLPAEVIELADSVIDTTFLTLTRKSMRAVFGELLRVAELKGLPAPSYQWFCRRINSLDAHRATKLRQGNRAAIPLEPRPPMSATPHTCDRPFERAHIDHTLLDMEIITEDGKSLGRPWLTLMIDEYSRRILAYYLTFNPPSAVSALAVLRLCVNRFKRLPDCIIIDGGREFASQNFEIITARYEVRLEKRPPARARFGSVIERMFGTLNTQLLYQLAGNTQATKNVRTVTKGNNPKGQAAWTLGDLDVLFERYLHDLYDKATHGTLGKSPADAFDFGIQKSGWRQNREIDYEEFAMWTLPSTTRGKSLVQPRRGVLINYFYYWCDEFRNPDVENTKVDVRYDPFDLGVAYAWVNRKWVKCVSSHHHMLKGRSLKDLQIAAEELRRSKSLMGKASQLTAKKLAEFMASVEPTAQQRKQQLKDAAQQDVTTARKTSADRNPGTAIKRSKLVIPKLDDIPDAEDI